MPSATPQPTPGGIGGILSGGLTLVGNFKPPLSIADKQWIRTYLLAHGYTQAQLDQQLSAAGLPGLQNFTHYWTTNSQTQPPWSQWDYVILTDYNAVTAGGGFGQSNPKTEWTPGGPLGWAKALVDFLGRLTQGATWIRIGEFLLGAILLAVGLNAALRGTLGKGAPQIRPPKTGFQYARKAFK
jgi:hypothetical protein